MSIRPLDFAPRDLDAETLRAAVRGEVSDLSRETALELLARQPHIEARHREYQAIVEDPREPSRLRHLAAACLGRIGTPESAAILERALEIEDEDVLAAVLQALGRIGERGTLDRLDRLRGRLGARLQPEAALATALIAHRLGIAGRGLPMPQDQGYLPLRGETHSPELRRASEVEWEAMARGLEAGPLGMRVAADTLYHVQCGPAEVMLAVNPELHEAPTLRDAFSTSRLVAVALHWDPDAPAPSPLVFAMSDPSPSRDGPDFTVAAPNGKLVFAGTGDHRTEGVAFSIRGVADDGTLAAEVEGILEPEGLQLTRIEIGLHPVRRREVTRDALRQRTRL